MKVSGEPGQSQGGHLTYRWAEASQCWGKTALRREHRAPAQRCPARWKEATEGLGQVVRELGAVPSEDVITWRQVASDAAGVLAVLSGRLEGVPGPLAHASGLLARSAQRPRQRPAQARCLPRGTIKSVAALMAQADRRQSSPTDRWPIPPAPQPFLRPLPDPLRTEYPRQRNHHLVARTPLQSRNPRHPKT